MTSAGPAGTTPAAGPWRVSVTLWVLLGAFAFLMASFVVGALRRPHRIVAGATTPRPAPVGDTLVGPAEYTLDATDDRRWTYFDFSRNAVVEDPGPLDWDLAVRRFHVIANGGPGFAGRGGIADLGPAAFDTVRTAPDTGYALTDADSVNPATRRWYRYGYSSHLLEPDGRVFAVRTADGRYAKVAIVSYYCGEARAACLTFRYVYQGAGGRSLAAP